MMMPGQMSKRNKLILVLTSVTAAFSGIMLMLMRQ